MLGVASNAPKPDENLSGMREKYIQICESLKQRLREQTSAAFPY
ncbi:MAG: hypothetical protein QXV95_07780 [Sulfolobales archaeon]